MFTKKNITHNILLAISGTTVLYHIFYSVFIRALKRSVLYTTVLPVVQIIYIYHLSKYCMLQYGTGSLFSLSREKETEICLRNIFLFFCAMFVEPQYGIYTTGTIIWGIRKSTVQQKYRSWFSHTIMLYQYIRHSVAFNLFGSVYTTTGSISSYWYFCR